MKVASQAAALMVLCVLTALLVPTVILGQGSSAPEQGFFRFPDLFQDKVVFTSEGDLWEVPVTGGTAVRLTTAEGEERFAKFSPDGKWIAFTAEYDGNPDVYVIPATGGEPVRLTFHPANDQVVDWTPDGRILYRSFFESGNYYPKLFTIAPTGGYPVSLPLDRGATLSFEPNGNRVAFTRTFLAFRTWKRYRGGWSEDIWVGNLKTRDFKKITQYPGNDMFPMWIGDRIYYSCDSTGRANIWSIKPDGSDAKQVTKHTDYDLRWPSAWQDKIVYQLAMDIWLFDVKTGQSQKIAITLPSDRLQRRAKIVDAIKNIDGYDLSPDGKRMALVTRGEIFTVPTKKEGLTRQISMTPTAREKFALFTPDGKSILTINDATGEEEFWSFDATGAKPATQLTDSKAGWHYDPQYSPDGKWMTYGDFKCRLMLMNVATKATTVIDSGSWEIRDHTWSPDSRFVAYTYFSETWYPGIKIYDLAAKRSYAVTSPMLRADSPAWDPDGKYLYFMQDVNFNPRLCHIEGRFIFDELTKPCLLVLKADGKSPFAPKADPEAEDTSSAKKDADKKDSDKKDKDKDKGEKKDSVKVEIDFDGLADRKIEVDVTAGNYGGLRAIPDKFYYLSWKDRGMLAGDEGTDSERKGRFDLHIYDLKEKKDTVVTSGIDSYDISDDNKIIVVKKGDQFIRMDAGSSSAPPPDDEDAQVKLDGISLQVDLRDEWKQMYNEAWRLERDFFYDPNMHGLDWPKVREKYGSLIDRISTRDELSDLIGETISELAAGHTYVWGGEKRMPKPVSVGMLGIDVTPDTASGNYKIARILNPDPGREGESSPLADPGLNVKPGDFLLAVDNQPVDIRENYLNTLVNKGGKLVQVTINSKPSLDGARQLVVRALNDENELRYRDWVEGRRQYVEKASGGKIGYIHLTDMGGAGLSQFGWQYPPQFKKDGLIIDVRFNGGGFVAEMILSQLARKVWAVGRAGGYGGVFPTPTDAFYGHMAVVCNGETGSDGETFTEGTKALKLGPVIGERTWGGWVGIRGDKPLEDRGIVTQPEFPGWSIDGKWLIEGWGTDPDVVVVNDPASMLAGKDPQLDYTIDYLLKKIAAEPRKYPPHPPYPNKSIK